MIYYNENISILDFIKNCIKSKNPIKDTESNTIIDIDNETKKLKIEIQTLQDILKKIKNQSIEAFKVDMVIQLTDQIRYWKNCINSNNKNNLHIKKLLNDLEYINFPEKYQNFKQYCKEQLLNLTKFDFNNDYCMNEIINIQFKLDNLNDITILKESKIIELISKIASCKLQLKEKIKEFSTYNNLYIDISNLLNHRDFNK